MFHTFLPSIWRRLGELRWPLLWLLQPKFILGANAIIINADGQIWLQRHRYWPDQAWGLPGGVVQSNESPDMAVIREIKEETGRDLSLAGIVSTELFFRRGVTVFYRATFTDSDQPLLLDRHEIIEAGFFNMTHLPEPLLPQHQVLLQKFAQEQKEAI